ncbi:Protein of unknown function [Haloechinothrix alba]|uniref:DUF2795 domain-containing protein n=1 Tax=Haloechinothrix alba TaxID=664784 RepID=A0A238VNT1_9PSEU|nr:DUF2795 domain-containing protein [Haloechinothrix alba]SNR36022.1 Protein of unknown function [Haloechinothrix alba]
MTDADIRRVRKALQGLEYPATKEDILGYVVEREPDARTERAVRGLPEGTYHSAQHVEDAVPQRPEQT